MGAEDRDDLTQVRLLVAAEWRTDCRCGEERGIIEKRCQQYFRWVVVPVRWP